MPVKPSYLSKTIIFNLVVALLAAFVPSASQFLVNHPSEVAIGFSVINVVLRLVSSGKVELY